MYDNCIRWSIDFTRALPGYGGRSFVSEFMRRCNSRTENNKTSGSYQGQISRSSHVDHQRQIDSRWPFSEKERFILELRWIFCPITSRKYDLVISDQFSTIDLRHLMDFTSTSDIFSFWMCYWMNSCDRSLWTIIIEYGYVTSKRSVITLSCISISIVTSYCVYYPVYS